MSTPFLQPSLLITRLFVFAMMALWAWDRIFDVEHATAVATRYYNLGPIEFSAMPHALIGVIMMGLYLLFLIGFKKKITYFLVFLVHAIGTAAVYKFSLPFFEEFRMTWFTSFPALMAMWLLWVLRREDTLLSLSGKWS